MSSARAALVAAFVGACLVAARASAQAPAPPPAGPLTIVADPASFATIAEAATAEERVDWRGGPTREAAACIQSFAATELRHFLAAGLRAPDSTIVLSSGTTLPTAGRVFLLTSDPSDPRFVGLDTAGAPPLPRGDGQGFRVFAAARAGGRVTVIQGVGPVGTLYGVYTYLDRLGVRWYGLGERGIVLPERAPALPDTMRRAERPAYLTRGFWAFEPRGDRTFFLWMARNRMNLWTADEKDVPFLRKLGFQLTQGGHFIQKTFLDPEAEYPYRHPRFAGSTSTVPDPYPVSPDYRGDANGDGKLSYFEAHPEWYGLVDGQRSPRVGRDSGDNFCTANADAVRELTKNLIAALSRGAWRDADVLAFWMHDQGRWCECDRCQALGTPTDRLFRLLHQVQTSLRAAEADGTLRHPVTLTSLAFLETMAPPTRPLPPGFDGPDFALTYFPIDRCYAHALADPTCTEINAGQVAEYDRWAVDPGRAYRGAIEVGEYYDISSFRSLPIVLTRVIRRDVPWYWAHGARHFHYMHVMTRRWGPWTVNHALLARLLWDPRADADAILRDFYARYYPVSRVSTRRFYESLETATANFKLLKHRARVGSAFYGVLRQIRGHADPFPLDHLHYETWHPAKNDAPDMVDMLAAMRAARAALDRSLALCPTGVEHERLAEDDHLLRYAEATLDFFDHLVRLYVLDLRGNLAGAGVEWKGLAAAAGRLRRMTDVSQAAGRDANSPDGFEATEATDLYQAYARKYGAAGGTR